jgi:type II secretory pathway component PulJ
MNTFSLGSKTPSESRASSVKPEDAEQSSQSLNFPSVSELNGRLRRLISVYQKETKKEEMRLAAKEKRLERRERIEQVRCFKKVKP